MARRRVRRSDGRVSRLHARLPGGRAREAGRSSMRRRRRRWSPPASACRSTRAGLSRPRGAGAGRVVAGGSTRAVLGLGALEYAVPRPGDRDRGGNRRTSTRAEPVSASLTFPWLIGVPAGFGLASLILLASAARFRPARSGWRRHLGHRLDALDLTMRLVCRPRAYGLGSPGWRRTGRRHLLPLGALHVSYADSPPSLS